MGIVDEKYSDDEVRNIMRNEGLEYAVFSYMTLDWIQNEELRKLCVEMNEARDKVEKYMEKKYGKNWQSWEKTDIKE